MSNEQRSCPHCGKPVPANLMGLCPQCMLKAGMATASEGPAREAFVPPAAEELGRHFPQLEILELIGRGGMGAVYKAKQRELDRVVALKILPPDVAKDGAFAERFAREAKALAALSHPHIVTLYEYGKADGLFYFLMEFVDGVNLRQVMAGGRMQPNQALAIVPQICEALQYAHDRGIVHRDIKPENILLSRDGVVKIADFGVAKIVGKSEERRAESGDEAAGETMGCAVGTPAYMAPEQKDRPEAVDHRADIFSLGVVFYQMLTGELPAKQIEPPSKKVQIDVRIDEIVMRAMERNPELRYSQASVFKTEVETIAGETIESRKQTEEIGPGSPHYWFRAKRYGWGWGAPSSWEGWIFLIVWLIAAIGGTCWLAGLGGAYLAIAFAFMNVMVVVLLAVCIAKGEPARWRWGDDKEKVTGRSQKAETEKRKGECPEIRIESELNLFGRQMNIHRAVSLVTPVRWLARIMGSLWALMLLIFVVGEGSPALGGQPPAVQWEFAAFGLWLVGFIVGWWFEGLAALVILMGSILFHAVEGRFPLGWAAELPGIVAVFYAVAWGLGPKRRIWKFVLGAVVLTVGALVLTQLMRVQDLSTIYRSNRPSIATRPSTQPSLIPKALRFIELLKEGQLDEAEVFFDSTMRRKMPRAKLAAFWMDLEAGGGGFEGYDAARLGRDAGFAAVYVPCRWARNRQIIEVVFDSSENVSGLWRLPDKTPTTKKISNANDRSAPSIIPADVPLVPGQAAEYYVGGKVLRVGVYSITRPITLKQAIVSAGLVSPEKDRFRATLTRRAGEDGEYHTIISLGELFSGKVPDRYLQRDDLITVEECPPRQRIRR